MVVITSIKEVFYTFGSSLPSLVGFFSVDGTRTEAVDPTTMDQESVAHRQDRSLCSGHLDCHRCVLSSSW